MRKCTPFFLSLLCLSLGAARPAAAQNITTIAGVGIGDDSLATRAELFNPEAIAVDKLGNTYIADAQGYRIRKVTAAGVISTYAGNGQFGATGDGGPATAASIGVIYGLAMDKTGNLLAVDIANSCVRKISASGIISTIAGNDLTPGYLGDGGPATAAELNAPVDVALDTSGNIYITDLQNVVVRRIDAATGIITTAVGDGAAGTTGDGGPATASELGYPFRIAFDRYNNMYVSEIGGYYICKIDPAGILHVVGGNGMYSIGPNGDGGPATAATMSAACGLAADTSGNLFFSDIDNNRIRRIDLNTGIVSAYAAIGTPGYSGDGGPATAAQVSTPEDLVCDAAGNLLICDPGNNLVRKVDAITGIMTRFAGQAGLYDEGMPAVNAELSSLGNVAADAAGNVYIAEFDHNRIRKINASGIITTVAGLGYSGPEDAYSGDGGPATAAHIYQPSGIAFDGTGNMYIADAGNYHIRKVTTAGIISTVGGTGGNMYNGDDMPATDAAIYSPGGVAVDAAGNIYIAETGNSRVRKITTDGNIHTIAGTATAGYAGDGGAAAFARLQYPSDVAVDNTGNVYVADAGNNRIRMIDTAGVITTIAGNGIDGFGGDGGPATAARISQPSGLKADGYGNIYFADGGNNRVRMIHADGTISTLAGSGVAGFSGDGGPALAARLSGPSGVAVTPAYIYIADGQNFRVRKMANTVAVADVAARIDAVTVYPNPAHDKITVSIPAGMPAGTTLSVIDMLGNTVYSAPALARQVINMQSLAGGIYMLQLSSGSALYKSIKVVKD